MPSVRAAAWTSPHLQDGGRIGDIGHYREPAEAREYLAQQFNPFSGKVGRLVGHAGDVAARSR